MKSTIVGFVCLLVTIVETVDGATCYACNSARNANCASDNFPTEDLIDSFVYHKEACYVIFNNNKLNFLNKIFLFFY